MENTTIKATVFYRPNGKRIEEEITHINHEDAKYINENGIKVSMEEDPNNDDIYMFFDYGKKLDNNPNEDPDEWVEIADGRTCQDTISCAIEMIRQLKAKLDENKN